jgi:hypothetical protein
LVATIPVVKGPADGGADAVLPGAAQAGGVQGVVVSATGMIRAVIVDRVRIGGGGSAGEVTVPQELADLFGGSTNLADVLAYIAANMGSAPSPILQALAGNIVSQAVLSGTLSVAAAQQILLTGALSSTTGLTGSLSVGVAGSIALVGTSISTSTASGALSLVAQVALAGGSYGMAGMTGALTVALGEVPSYVFNYQPGQLTKAASALAAVKAGTGRFRAVHVGESTTRGVGCGDVGNVDNGKLNSWPTKMGQRIASAAGVSACIEDVFGTGNLNITSLRNSYQPGLDPAASWAPDNAPTMGGWCFINNTDEGNFTFTSQTPIDTFEFFDLLVTTAGAVTYNVDGGPETILSQTGGTARRKTVIPAGSVGIHTLNIKRSSGISRVCGVRAYNSTLPALDVLNLGWASSKLLDWTQNPSVAYSPIATTTELCQTADLVTLQFQINDASVTSESLFKSRYQALINAVKAGGASVILCTDNPISTSIQADSFQQASRQWIKDLAVTNNLPVIDQYALYTSYSALLAAGWMFDQIHPNKLHNADYGVKIADAVLAGIQRHALGL